MDYNGNMILEKRDLSWRSISSGSSTPRCRRRTSPVSAWTAGVRTMRESKAFAFVELNDGSYFRNLQVVLEADKLDNYRELTKQITLGAAVAFEERWC